MVKDNMQEVGVTVEDAKNRARWRQMSHCEEEYSNTEENVNTLKVC